MIRPEAREFLRRWWDLFLGLGLMALGLRMAWGTGYVVPVFGVAVAALGGAVAITSAKRPRPPRIGGRGLVQVIEGQVAFFAPDGGGFLALDDLVAVASDGENWVLTGADGTRLQVPRGAVGVEALTDALLRLPGLEPAALLPAGGVAAADPQRIWRRPGAVAPLTWADQRDRSGGR